MEPMTELSPSPSSPPAPARRTSPEAPSNIDQRIILHSMTWKDYELLLTIRGDRSGVRMAYLNGAIELMSPSIHHESIKKTIARLLETYADERGLEVNGYGSWTLKNTSQERGLEPDECYVLGVDRKDVPDLAIEVVWTSGGLEKLEIYKALGVGEVWLWERATGITAHLLRDGEYTPAASSLLFPDLDLQLLASFAEAKSQSQAVKAFRAALRGPQV